jgi:hypothetical protein
MPRPRKIKYPIRMAEMLRLVLPKKRPEDRMKYFRSMVRDNLWLKLGREPGGGELADELAIISSKQFDQHSVDFYRNWILYNLPVFEAENLRKRAKAGAAKRWEKKN